MRKLDLQLRLGHASGENLQKGWQEPSRRTPLWHVGGDALVENRTDSWHMVKSVSQRDPRPVKVDREGAEWIETVRRHIDHE